MNERETTVESARTRREALGAVGAAGALVLAGCTGGDDGDDGNGNEGTGGTTTPSDEDTARIGLSLSQSGSRNNEAAQMRQGYELAAHHINEGTGGVTVEPFQDIGEDGGLLGRQIELVVEDTESTEEGAEESASTLVDEADVVMFTGGSSADEGLAHQQVADDTETLYMGGFTPGGGVSGVNCSRYAFNEMYNAKMAADSLAPIVNRLVSADGAVSFAQMYPDNRFGEEFSTEIRNRFQELGEDWSHQGRESTREDERSYSSTIDEILSADPDLVVLNYYGIDAANALRDLRERADPGLTTVVPLFNREFARTAGDALEDVIGTVHWAPEPPGGGGWAMDASHPFRDRFLATWDDIDGELDVPAPNSHLAYVQLCQYAAAVSRAGTFDEDAVIDELEGHTYAYGNGEQVLRACDHQAMRAVPVVVGLPKSEHQPGNYFRLSDLQMSLSLGSSEPYTCDQPPATYCEST